VNDSQPVFIQIQTIIENDILNGTYTVDDLIISTTQISRVYNVNPTTAVKAISCLTEDGILYKRPGIGMCVVEGAREKIFERRKKSFLETALNEFLAEATTLNISTDELITLIKERTKNDCI
jgi:DNA-binding transcriptional regulator YhcF (GntR family)